MPFQALSLSHERRLCWHLLGISSVSGHLECVWSVSGVFPKRPGATLSFLFFFFPPFTGFVNFAGVCLPSLSPRICCDTDEMVLETCASEPCAASSSPVPSLLCCRSPPVHALARLPVLEPRGRTRSSAPPRHHVAPPWWGGRRPGSRPDSS